MPGTSRARRRFTRLTGAFPPTYAGVLLLTGLAAFWPAPAQGQEDVAHQVIRTRVENSRRNVDFYLLHFRVQEEIPTIRAGNGFTAYLDRSLGDNGIPQEVRVYDPAMTIAVRGGEKPGGGRYKIGYDYESCTGDCIAVVFMPPKESLLYPIRKARNPNGEWTGYTGDMDGSFYGIFHHGQYMRIRVAKNAPQGATFEVGFTEPNKWPNRWVGTLRTTYTVRRYNNRAARISDAFVDGSIVGLEFAGASALRQDGPGKPGPYGPAISAFTVKVNGQEVTVSSLDINGQWVRLELGQAVSHTDEVRVSYDPPSTNQLQTTEAVWTPPFENRRARNVTPPSGPGSGGANGTELFLGRMVVGEDDVDDLAGFSVPSSGLAIGGSLSGASDGFTVGGVEYPITAVSLATTGTRSLAFHLGRNRPSGNRFSKLALVVGGTSFRLADANSRFSDGVVWSNTSLSWSAGDIVPVQVVDYNQDPVFPGYQRLPAARSIIEVPTRVVDVGDPIRAADPNGDQLTYSLEATGDADSFTINSSTGQLRTLASLEYRHAMKSHYDVQVKATDGFGGESVRNVRVNVVKRSQDLPPNRPGPPQLIPSSARAIYPGNSIRLRFTEHLADRHAVLGLGEEKPSLEHFSVTVDGRRAALTHLHIEQGYLYLQGVSPRLQTGQNFRVSYADPNPSANDRNALEDWYGEDVPSFDVTATVGFTEPTERNHRGSGLHLLVGNAATRVNAARDAVLLRFSKALQRDSDNRPLKEQFEIKVDGARRAFVSLELGSASTDLTLNGTGDLPTGVPITVSYRDPNPGIDDEAVLQNTAGGDAPSFFDLPIEGNALSVGDVRVVEGEDATADFTVTLAPAASQTVSVSYATADGTATAGADYTATSGTLTFNAGDTRKTISVPILDDTIEDSGETFRLTLSSPSGGGYLADASATATIYNDELEQVLLTAEFVDVPETHGGEAFTFRLDFSEDVSGLDSLTLEVTGGAVSSVTRVQADSDQSWNITVEPDGTQDVTVTLPETTDCEATDAICTADKRPLSTALTATVPNAVREPPTLSVADAQVPEAEGATLHFIVTLSEAVISEVTVDYATSDGSATEGDDYTTTSGTLTFAMGETEKIVSVPVLDDADVEESETLTLTLSNPAGATLGRASATGTIDEILPVLSVADAAALEAEGATLDFAVTLSEAWAAEVTVGYATADGTTAGAAGAGVDYTAVSGTLTFAAGETGKTVSVPVLDDADLEESETLTLALSDPVGASLDRASATGTIDDDEVPPDLWITDAEALEGEGATLDFRVLLREASTLEATVDYATADDTGAGAAEAGVDYTAVSGTLTFAAGETEKTVSVPVLDDAAAEGSETLTLSLSNPVGAQLLRASATGTISDDEPPVEPLTASFGSVPLSHGGEAFTFELEFSEEVSLEQEDLAGGEGQQGALSVTGGRVTGASRVVEGENRRWSITVAPDGEEDVTVTLAETTDCEAQGAICTDDGRPLSAAATATIPSAPPPLTATIGGAPEAHEGAPLVLQVHFSEATTVSWEAMRDHVVSVTNGQLTRARRLEGDHPENAAWEVTLEPTGGDLTIGLPATTDCEAEDAVCTEDGRPLSEAVTATIAEGTVPPLTAEFDAPAEHDGSEDITVWLDFNGAADLNKWRMANRAVAVTGGRIRSAEHEIGLRHSWRLTVEPTSIEDMVLSVAPPESCGDSGALCATDGRKLSSGTEVRVKGPASIPLTAIWLDYRNGHDGSSVFVLEALFSWPVATSSEAMRDAVRVTNGETTRAFPKEGQPKTWVFWIKPLYNDTVRVELLATTDCAAEGAICTEDGRPLSNTAGRNVLPTNPDAVDETAPELQRAEVDGAQLVLLYDEGLDTTSTPEAGAFAVAVAGQARDLAANDPVAVDGRRVRLTLASAVGHGDTVTVSYTVPSSNPVQDRAGNTAAALSDEAATNHTPQDTPAGDTTAPELQGAEASTDSVVLTYSEALDESSTPAAAAFAVTVAGEARSLAATGPVAVSGSTVTLALDSAAAPGDTVEVSYTQPSADALQDTAGNRAASATIAASVPADTAVTPVVTVPLTAEFQGLPERHDGGPFTFQLVFSEEFSISYALLRGTDSEPGAISVTGGGVTGAGRVVAGENRQWNITVEPGGTGDVTITLPETTDCEASGAICTGDSRPLSATVTATVAGETHVPAPELTLAGASATEGGNATADFAVTLSRAATDTVTVDYATSDGTAAAGTDYTATSGTLTFAAGDTAKTVSVPVLDDAVDEEDETFTLTLSNASGASLADTAATGTIADNDTTATPLTATFEDMPESHHGSRISFGLTFSEEFSVSYQKLRDEAFEVTGGTVFGAQRKETGSNRRWTISVDPDSADIAVTITLPETTDCNAAGAICAAENRRLSHSLTATVEGEAAAVPSLAVADASATEGDEVTFTVSLSEASGRQVTVDYATSSGTAESGTDFTAASGTLTFAAGDSSRTVSVATADDTVDENDETFTLTLSNASGATLGNTTATGTIVDNDTTTATPLTATFEDMPASHDGSRIRFGLTFSEDLSVSYRTLRDEAFEVTGGTVFGAQRKQPGSNRRWTISVDPDSAGSAVTITLPETTDCEASGAICTNDKRPLSHSLTDTVAVEVEEPTVPSLAVAGASATEGDAVTFTVSLSEASGQRVTVDYATSGGTAASGTDFTAASGTLTFDAGDRSKTVNVTTTDDSDNEEDETLTLTLSNASGATLGNATATGTIVDNDTAATPLTATFEDMPETHDGSRIRFGLTFSEELDVSYRTLRDHAFSVTGGTVFGAQRKQTGSNRRWTISVDPTSASDTVTITLPETTICAAKGAICTADNRPLSHSLTDTVIDAASSSSSDIAGGTEQGEVEAALAAAGGITPEEAAAALFGEGRLSESQLDALDRLGNRNGRYDIGDLVAWRERCRQGTADCGGSPASPGPAGAAALLAAVPGGRRGSRGGPGGRRGAGRRRRTAAPRQALAMLFAVALAWSCTDGGLVEPAVPEQAPDPGFLTVSLVTPADSRDSGVLLELEGPGIAEVRAPGFELFESRASGRHQVMVAGALRAGPVLQIRVPDRNRVSLYRVRVMQVAGEDYALRDEAEYRTVITR